MVRTDKKTIMKLHVQTEVHLSCVKFNLRMQMQLDPGTIYSVYDTPDCGVYHNLNSTPSGLDNHNYSFGLWLPVFQMKFISVEGTNRILC